MKEINKKQVFSDDNDIVGYFFDGDCFIYPMTNGSLRRAPKELSMILLKSVLIWATFFLVILPGIAWVFNDFNAAIEVYKFYWWVICFIWLAVKTIFEVCVAFFDYL